MGLKQVLVLRGDLDLSTGKLVAQACHASLQAFTAAGTETRSTWRQQGAKKVTLTAQDANHITQLAEHAEQNKLPYAVIRDAGKTELKQGTVTALGIGPGPEQDVDQVTGGLPLLQ
jgi:PTH2 family peptidyl-tRNA hydrolase